MIGTTFGPYRIDEKLGQGGMGVVYKAFDTTLQRPVALKMIQIAHQDTAADEASVARFMREARAASRLTHPTIVTIYHFGVEGETQYIVMEYVEGKTLRKLIHDEPMPLDQLYDIAIQVAEGLATAHENNIVHRDMKADNVMVTTKGQVKILDFGLAKLKDPVTTTEDSETIFQTQAGLAVGTASHMSPEQAMGREVDGKSDVFSFGVVLYHMAAGKVPFAGPNPTITMARILEAEPDPVRRHNPNIPEALEELIHRCLQKNRMFRPSSAELVQTLKALRDTSKVPTGVPAAAAVAATPSSQSGGGRLATPPSPSPAAGTIPGAPVGAVPVVVVGVQTPEGIKMMPAGAVAAPFPEPTPAPRVIRDEGPPPRPSPAYYPVKLLYFVVSWGLIAAALLILLYVTYAAMPQVAREVDKIRFWADLKPVMASLGVQVHKIVGAKALIFSGWDIALVIVACAIFVLRLFVTWPLYRWENRLKRGVRAR